MAPPSPEVALAISSQKALYGIYADTKQWDKWANAIALPDARYVYTATNGKPLALGSKLTVFDTSKGCAAFFAGFFSQLQTLHNLGPGTFDQVSPDKVHSIFSVEDQLYHKYLGTWMALRGGGFYYETWKLVDGKWYISELKFERAYQKMTLIFKLFFLFFYLTGISPY
ncbi:unnamed protein product [Clonostachys chloroleuca]|uniref:SnoaL-like domain-containing protein n=1 Tax=Clonostachys chloroleuca TaxID=1926264 RepID=A0AA35PWX9_9HYPO|nr:unnamed protein product [Clonostachys chloroleuca]